jgi:hypothetical protein
MKLKLKEVRQVISEAVKERALIEASASAKMIIAEKESFFGGLARKAGFSDPSRDVDDPKHVKKTLDSTISTAAKTAKEFQASSLNTTKEINKFHEAIKDAMDKITSLSDTLGPDMAANYHKKMVELAREFYSLLKRESDRIDSFLKTIASDLEDKGVNKRAASQNTTGLAKKPGFVPKRPGDMIGNDDDVLAKSGVRKKPSADDHTAVMNYDDPDQVNDFLKGKHKVKARS